MDKQKQVATIFNNVMGPVGVGPSTSNTCGPCRVAYLSGKLSRNKLQRVRVIFPAEGGYASPNGKGMRSDYAFAHGLLGRLPDSDYPLLDAFHDLRQQGIALEFMVDQALSNGGEHLMSILELTDVDGECTTVCGLSKGGGIIEITRINDFAVSIGGEYNLLLVFTAAKNAVALCEKLRGTYPELTEYQSEIIEAAGMALISIPTYALLDKTKLDQIAQMDAVTRVCALPSILPVVVRPQPQVPFENANDLEAYCAQNGKTLTEAAICYEKAVSGWSTERVRDFALSVVRAMRNSVNCGLKPELKFDGIVVPFAATMMRRQQQGTALNDGIVTRAATYSLAIMEYSNASGVVVCMPTAGASGTIAGALLAAAEQLGSDDNQIVDALLAAGVVGVSISENNDFCGGVYGCQAEVGCASSMAAAGLVVLAGGNVSQAMNAASMALQNMLGLICDPVCGLVQVPCFSRNISAVSNAIVCANVSMLGFDATIPLQDAFEAMKASGSRLPVELKGCGGGLCDTTKGRCLLAQYSKKDS